MDATPGARPQTLRLFLALWPTAGQRAALEAQAATWRWTASARRTVPDRLHVTIHFLGNVAAARLPQLRERLRVPWTGCELVLDRAAVWPGGIAVLEASEVPDALARLHAELAGRLRELELPVEERRFRPHVTFARKAAGTQPPDAFTPLHWQAGPGYVLVRSVPGRGYEPVQLFG